MPETYTTSRVDYEQYILSPEWQARRSRIIAQSGGHCVLCRSDKNLNVHHNTYERLGNEDDGDLTCLCRRCHDLYHRAIDPRTVAKYASRPATKKERRKTWETSTAVSEAGEPWAENLVKVVVTSQYINLLKRKHGVFSPRAMRLMGVCRYPSSGWMKRIKGKVISVDGVELQAEQDLARQESKPQPARNEKTMSKAQLKRLRKEQNRPRTPAERSVVIRHF